MQLHVTGVEAKRKLSQNKPEPDRVGAADGLARSADPRHREIASLMHGRPDTFS